MSDKQIEHIPFNYNINEISYQSDIDSDIDINFTDEQHNIYSSYFMYCILNNNNKNIEDPEFINMWNKFGNIDTAQLIDLELHKEEFIRDIEPNIKKCMVLFKNQYKDAKIGDIINSGKVIGVFTLTVWILLDEITHEHCCPSNNCCNSV
jgi:hypothetical protein